MNWLEMHISTSDHFRIANDSNQKQKICHGKRKIRKGAKTAQKWKTAYCGSDYIRRSE
jgi:hypothetical protein